MSPAGQPHTLPSERDFKSLVSASLRQSRFLFVVSFDFSLRERFFLREREGFALFWRDNITTFFAPCQSCKIVSSCRAWSSERPGPGASAGGVRPAQMRSSGWVWWRVGWWVDGCIDGRNWVMGYCWFLEVTFEVIEVVFDVPTDSITSYLWCSLLFICPVPTLPVLSPATSFTEISPKVILDYGIKNRYIIVRYKTIILLWNRMDEIL